MSSAYLLYRDHDEQYQMAQLEQSPLTIGSHSPCSILLPFDGIGPVHAALESDRDSFILRCLSHVKTLTCNGESFTEGALSHGDRVELGGRELRFLTHEKVAARLLYLTFERHEGEIPVELPVSSPFASLGRVEGDILVDDPGISAAHISFSNFGEDALFIRDLGSTNGTTVNGKNIGDGYFPIQEGDVIELGKVKISTRFGDAPKKQSGSMIQRTVLFISDSAEV